MKYTLITLLIVFGLGARAQQTEIFAPKGVALNGYDVVSFHTNDKPVNGTEKFSLEWKNVKWYFVSKENLETFQKNPELYEPQYGGYCAYGASRGYKAPTIADTWALINNKLYFNYNQKVKVIWEQNRNAYIDSANAKWQSIRNN